MKRIFVLLVLAVLLAGCASDYTEKESCKGKTLIYEYDGEFGGKVHKEYVNHVKCGGTQK